MYPVQIYSNIFWNMKQTKKKLWFTLAITKSYKYENICRFLHLSGTIELLKKKNRRQYKVNSFLFHYFFSSFLILKFSLSLILSLFLSHQCVYICVCFPFWMPHMMSYSDYNYVQKICYFKKTLFYLNKAKKETRIDFHCTVFFLSSHSFIITIFFLFNLSINNYK